MALLIKNTNVGRSAGNFPTGQATLDQLIHVLTSARSLPQSTTDVIFKVRGGRVWVRLLIGEVTTVIQGTDPVLKVSSQKLDAAMTATVGTTYDIASTLDLSSDEVGTIYTVEGDGTAIVSPQVAGAGYFGALDGFIAPRGQIYLTTGASKTGATKWDLWYLPLDEGAYVEGTAVAAVKV